MPSLTTAQAQALLKFLLNTQIIGSDAPQFMECVFALQMIAGHQEIQEPATNEDSSG